MPSIGAIVRLISLDVTTKLVAAGLALAPVNGPWPLTVTSATNASPIVVGASTPHGVNVNANVVVSGVAGNTAANGTWLAVPTDPTHLALYSVGAWGIVSPSAGSGAYVSGGRVDTGLTDTRILIGRQHIYEMSIAPRVVFVPTTGKYAPKSASTASPKASAGNPNAELLRGMAARSLMTDRVGFEVHVWGIASPPDPEEGDFDATHALAQQVLASTHLLTVGRYIVGDGVWADQRPSAGQFNKAGHEYVFSLAFDTMVLDSALTYPTGAVAGKATVTIVTPEFGSETVTLG